MKTIKNLLYAFSLLLLIISCNNNDYEIPSEEISDLYILTSAGVNTVTMRTEVNNFFSLSDISQGTLERKWTINEGDFFLQGPLPDKLPNYDDYIINAGDTVSKDQTVHVMFKKGDSLTKVKYYGVFKDSTEFEFNVSYDNLTAAFIPDTIRTKKIEDKWIAEYTYLIDVYDTVVATPELRRLDETIIDHKNTASMTVKFGDQIIIEDLSAKLIDNNARPQITKFRMHTLEEDEEARTGYSVSNFDREGDFTKRIIDTLQFSRLGEYQLELTASRLRDEDLGASSDVYDVPMIFNVVPLDEDLVLDTTVRAVAELDDNRISIPISSRLKAIEGNVLNDFTVKVDGTVVPTTNVSIASYNGGNGGLVYLSLETPLVPTDAAKVVTVSYTGSTIMSLDDRVLQSFTDEPIEVFVPTPMNKVGGVLESENDEILIRFNQNIDPVSISNSADPTVGFNVILNGSSIDIASISVDANDTKMLKITLSGIGASLYQDDVITIAHDGTGDIRSVGDGAIAGFTAITVQPYFKNLITDGGFEGTLGDFWVEGASGAGATVALSADVAFEGAQSAKLTALKPRLESGSTLNYEGGATYVVSYRRYILSSSVTLDDSFHQLDHGDKIWLDAAVGSTAVTPRWYGELYPAGTAPALDTWTLVETKKLMTEDGTNKKIRIQPVPTGGTDYTVYYDDFKIYKEDLRN
ncbi:hypothetical protein [Polaribacter staleyi]|uniref:hypothetical protein n=1 Tax=Polaribacter staleyi TaxID=2022337 RepID=UPI0031BA0CC5